MANIGFDARTRFDENQQEVPLATKQVANEACSVKKQLLGDLKNRMPNQQNVFTPIKANAAKIDGLPKQFNASPKLREDVLRKQQRMQDFWDLQYQLEFGKEGNYKPPEFDEEIFDSWDYDRKCCKRNKTEEELWAEECIANFDRLLNVSDGVDDEKKSMAQLPILCPDFDDDLLPVNIAMPEPEQPAVDVRKPSIDFDKLLDLSVEADDKSNAYTPPNSFDDNGKDKPPAVNFEADLNESFELIPFESGDFENDSSFKDFDNVSFSKLI